MENLSRHPWRKLDIKSQKVKSRPLYGALSSKVNECSSSDKPASRHLHYKVCFTIPCAAARLSLPASQLHIDGCPLLCYAEDNLLRFTNTLTDMMKLRAFVIAEVISEASGDPASRSFECTGLARVAGRGRRSSYRPANQPRRRWHAGRRHSYEAGVTVWEYDLISDILLSW